VWLLGGVEQEVHLSDRVDRAGCPDPWVTTYQRRRAFAGESSDELAAELRVFVVQVRGAGVVGDRDDLPGAVV